MTRAAARSKVPDERAERAKRARAAGNQRTAAAARTRKEVVEPEKSDALAAKQAAQALAKLKLAEATRGAQIKAEDVIRDRALARRDGKAKSPVKAPAGGGHAHPVESQFDLTGAIKQLQPEFVQCRDWGHSWRPFTARWIQNMNHYESILRCARCETERVRFIGKRGEILGSKYDYQDGYQMKGSGVLSTSDRDQIRLASIRIIEVKDTVQE